MRQLTRGFSLVELMVSMTLGLLILAAMLGFFVSNLKANSTTLGLARLNQELQTVMGMVARDVRRAGYRGDAIANRDIGDKAFMFMPGSRDSGSWVGEHIDSLASGGSHDAGGPYQCILLMADHNGDADASTGVGPSPDEVSAYRYDATSLEVEVGSWSSTSAVTTPACSSASLGWQGLTSADVEITALDFTMDPAVVAGESRVVQSVEISLSGNLAGRPEISLTLLERVKIRNNVY
ncbi:prepilin-type N-terminal cleavage/methylation domain-containing protein [Ferrimonas marina]|uniref:Type IV pilus assembly protein PilW n=1 Tax=Ferrimonas marina TaxID=299255 RepID=A0A1M5VWM7_9GAMM|nr:prepilin-type N-terminal cleavage/methylation domain-containing protein [Ferrimonas marina]SHH79597.1 type IV pilus assembly protein PilW [Ferrimonas marina]